MREGEEVNPAMKRSVMLITVAIGGAALAATPILAPALRVIGGMAAVTGFALFIVARRRPRIRMTLRGNDRGAAASRDRSVEVTQELIAAADLQRRAAIKMLGLGFLGAIPFLAAPGVIDRLLSNPGSGKDRARLASRLPNPNIAPAHTGPIDTKDGRIRQWTMFVDLRHCDGCQSQGTAPQCTTACIEGHFAPRPMEWIEVYEGDLAGGGTQFIPTPCQHCQNPPCVNVCPVGATFSSPEGTVLIDQERCIGCRICMAACPYDRRFFNWGDPPVPPEALLADYSPDTQAPATRGTVMKCDFCPDMVRDGTLPFCIQACPNDAIWYGDLEENIATNGKEIVSAARFLSQNSAYRLKENLGTEPRVYYIAGHGELVGRDPYTSGRAATTWPWLERAKGAKIWSR